MQSVKEHYIIQYFVFSCICAMAFFKTILGLPIPTNMLSLAAIGLILLCKTPGTGLVTMIGFQMLDAIIQVALGSTSVSFLLVAIPLYLLRFGFITREIDVGCCIKIICLVFLCAIEVYHISSYSVNGMGTLLIWMISMVFFIFSMSGISTSINRSYLIATWATSLIVVMLINMGSYNHPVLSQNGYSFSSYNSLYRLGDQYRTLGGPNTLCLEAGLLFSFSICEFVRSSVSKVARAFPICGLAISTIVGFLTFSRAFIVEVLIVVLIVMVSRKDVHFWAKFSLIAIGAVVLIYVLSTPVFVDQVSGLVNRFDEGNSNRFTLIERGIELFISSIPSLLFGNGIIYPMNPDINFTSHNIVIDSFAAFGLCGVFLWGIIISSAIKYISINRERIILLNLIPLVILAANEFIIGSVRDTFVYLYVPLMFFLASQTEYEELNNDGQKNSLYLVRKK